MAFKSRIIYRDAGKGKGSQQGLGGPWVGAGGRYCSSEEQRERDKGVRVSPAPTEAECPPPGAWMEGEGSRREERRNKDPAHPPPAGASPWPNSTGSLVGKAAQ